MLRAHPIRESFEFPERRFDPRNAFRVVYAVQLGEDIWVVHAFQKKSTRGVKTPKAEIDLVKDRLKRLKEMLR